MADHLRRPRVLDVLAAEQPWEVPDEWLAGVRGRLRIWADDPSSLRPPGAFPDFLEGTPAAVWLTHEVAALLTGWIPVLHGEYADIAAELTRDFHRPSVRFGGAGHLVRVAPTDWPLQVVAGTQGFHEQARHQALLLSRDVVSLFVDAPPMAARAQALTAAYDRVLADREATRMHVLADYGTILQFWRTAALSDAERAVLPELGGPASAVKYSLEALRHAHTQLSAVVPGGEAPDFAQLVARMILAGGLDAQPAAVGQALGIAGWDVEKALGELKKGFDPRAWLDRNMEWLGRAIAQDQEVLARYWAAATTRVSVHLAGVPEQRPWPEVEIPDLGAFFQLLDRGTTSYPLPAASIVVAAEPVIEVAPPVEHPVVPEEPVVEEPVVEESVVEEPVVDEPVVDEPVAEEPVVEEVVADEPVAPKPVSADDGGPLAELEALVGLESVKESVRRMVAEIKTNQRRKDLGIPVQERVRHMVFVGKPGTAKTTIARLLARIYKQLGVLEKGHVIEVDRSDLVGPGVGTTAPLTAAKFREALGGVLFVDEAYTLSPENTPGDFGIEAIATLLKMMEDHRDECVVIVAGYHREMQRFLESNTGLSSRFPKLLSFSEYNADQLVAIFELQARQKGMTYTDDVLAVVRRIIPATPRAHNFGNGRFIRNILEEAISNQAIRLAHHDPDTLTERDLREILPEDVKPAQSMRAEDYLFQKEGT
ncbi:AAA family ATPase [Kribbella sp. NBC_01245]|uniref:AAA family ATPase n=1 Tax=Kribbella sp. NBC_01245 TaxID=2903578 RepID=UPI002E2BF423|nr:AAA family ATPase [Kribbella sp. NBC_01245]